MLNSKALNIDAVDVDSLGFERQPGLAGSRRTAHRLSGTDIRNLLYRRTGLVLVSLAVLGWVSNRWTPLSWLPPAALAVLALILLGRAMRLDVDDRSKNPVLKFSTGLIALALALGAVYWWLFRQPWLPLAAVALGFVGIAGAGSRLRHLLRRSFFVPITAAVVAGVLTIVGAVMADRLDSRLPIIVYVLSILAGYLALVFGTEPWLQRADKLFTSPRIRIAALAALVVGVLWLAFIGAGIYALVILAIIALLTLLITLDGDGEIIAVLLLVALAWAVFPRGVDRSTIEDDLAQTKPLVVAMGDSYMSGEGAERYENGTNVRGENICRRAPTAWSEQFRSDTTETVSLACSGATIDHVIGSPQYQGEPIDWPDGVGEPDGANQLTQLSWLVEEAGPERIDSVVVTIGGNDAGFSRAGIACVGPGDCSELAAVWESDFAALEARLAELYAEIRTTLDELGGDEIPLLVTGYPVPLTEEGCAWTWLSADEHAFIVRFVGLLNGSVAGAAAQANVGYIDTIPASLERKELRFCEDQPWRGGLNFFELNPMEGSLLASLDPRNWVNNSFHPNERGHLALTEAVQGWFEGERSQVPAVPPSPDTVQAERPCQDRQSCNDYVDAWSRREIARFFRQLSAPIILFFVGSWLVITPLQFSRRRKPLQFRLIGPILAFAERVL